MANAYDTAGAAQFFQLSWRQNPVLAGSGDGASTTSYELFRGDDLTYHERANYGQFNLDADPIDPAKPDAIKRIAVVADPAQVPAAMLGHADRSVPAVDANFGRTWWFAIRAVHQGPPGCGNAVSVLSPPVFTALRQRVAPLAPNANQVVPQNLNCLRVACMVAAPASDEVSATPLDASVAHYRVRCTRRNGIASAQIRVTDLSTVPGVEIIPPTLVEFPEGAAFVEFDFARPLETINNKLAVECQGVAFDGTLSRWDVSRAKGVATANHFVLHQFLVGAIAESERLALRDDLLWATLTNDPQAGESPCAPERLLTVSPDSGLILPVSFRVTFTPRSEEFRLYRRVNDGPLSLVSQGLRVPVTNATVEVSDKTPPTTCCTLSYYVQLLDADANASPLALVLTKNSRAETARALAPAATRRGPEPRRAQPAGRESALGLSAGGRRALRGVHLGQQLESAQHRAGSQRARQAHPRSRREAAVFQSDEQVGNDRGADDAVEPPVMSPDASAGISARGRNLRCRSM